MVAHILTSALRGLLNTTVGYSLKHEEREEEASSNFSPRLRFMEDISTEEQIAAFCRQGWAGEEQAGNSSDEGLDESMCGLSNYDVFSLGLLDPPPRIKEEDCSLTATLADPQLSTTAPQRQHSGTLAAQAEHADTGRPGQCNQHKMEPQVSSLRDQLRQFQYPPLMGEAQEHDGASPGMLRKLDLESLTSVGSFEGRSSGSLGPSNSGSHCAEACVPDLSPRSYLPSPRGEACVPDFFRPCPAQEATRQDGRPGRQLRPRTSGSFSAIKAEVEEWGAGGGHASSDGGCARVPSRLCDASSEMPQTYADGSAGHTRSDCLQRYRDKKLRRHFTHKVRYTARKLNADRRPRIKGRFVKALEMAPLDMY